MPHADVFCTNRRFDLTRSFDIAFFADDVVSGDMRVAGVQASAHGCDITQAMDELGDLLKAASEGEFSSGSILDQDLEIADLGVKSMDRFGNRFGRQAKALFAGESSP